MTTVRIHKFSDLVVMPKDVYFHGIVWDFGNVILAKCCIFELPKI